MRIITSKHEKRALNLITQIRHALESDNVIERLKAQEALTTLTGIIGGLNGLISELEKINGELAVTDLAQEARKAVQHEDS